jgi:small neutral amino acid transporter SnatA (MarC family)
VTSLANVTKPGSDPWGIDAATRIVGFFVSAIGVGLIFDGVAEALEMGGVRGNCPGITGLG